MKRAYYFGNMYMSSIQQGIQALHATSEMYLKYSIRGKLTTDIVGEKQRSDLHEWGMLHKTVVLLNGGDHAALIKIADFINNEDNPYAWAEWNEGDPDLNGAMTCVSIVLPARIYESAKELRRPPRYRDKSLIATDLTDWELAFVEVLNGCRLAS
jgi:hypothetical protein